MYTYMYFSIRIYKHVELYIYTVYISCLPFILGQKLPSMDHLCRRAGEWRILFRRAFRVPTLASNDQSPTPDEESTPAVPAQAAAGADGEVIMDGTSIPRDNNSW